MFVGVSDKVLRSKPEWRVQVSSEKDKKIIEYLCDRFNIYWKSGNEFKNVIPSIGESFCLVFNISKEKMYLTWSSKDTSYTVQDFVEKITSSKYCAKDKNVNDADVANEEDVYGKEKETLKLMKDISKTIDSNINEGFEIVNKNMQIKENLIF
jgi:hypothetical protein